MTGSRGASTIVSRTSNSLRRRGTKTPGSTAMRCAVELRPSDDVLEREALDAAGDHRLELLRRAGLGDEQVRLLFGEHAAGGPESGDDGGVRIGGAGDVRARVGCAHPQRDFTRGVLTLLSIAETGRSGLDRRTAEDHGRMSFDVEADAYARFMGRYSEPLAVEFAEALSIRPGSTAIDVGCGPGALTAELVRRLGTDAVSAVDPSESFVEAARDRLPGVDIRVGSAEALPFESDSVDLALAQLVVHFMSDPVLGVSEMARVTKPGGRVAANVWDHAGEKGPLSVYWRAARDLDPDVRDESGLAGAREGHLCDLFTEAGLRDVDVVPADRARRLLRLRRPGGSRSRSVSVRPGSTLRSLDDARREALRAPLRGTAAGRPVRDHRDRLDGGRHGGVSRLGLQDAHPAQTVDAVAEQQHEPGDRDRVDRDAEVAVRRVQERVGHESVGRSPNQDDREPDRRVDQHDPEPRERSLGRSAKSTQSSTA